MPKQAKIGVIGLSVMGRNLALNLAGKEFPTAIFNRNPEKTRQIIQAYGSELPLIGCYSMEELMQSLMPPRKILLMVKAGEAVDNLLEQLSPFLQADDIVIDGGNSFYQDTIRREKNLAEKHIYFLGMGISGGESGALHGPSMMPGGNWHAWETVRTILQTIAAQDPDHLPCCEWIGPNGAGHFVKMVHNGIEYADMQLICEAYYLLKKIGKLSAKQISEIFRQWNQGKLESYLIQITGEILSVADPESGDALVERILDTAGQKGTGAWTAETALQLQCATPTLAEAVFFRNLAANRPLREQLFETFHPHTPKSDLPVTPPISVDEFIEAVHQGLYAGKICAYAQGFQLLQAASRNFLWNLNLGNLARIWRGGCIIRARFLDGIARTFDQTPNLESLLQSNFFLTEIANCLPKWRLCCTQALNAGLPLPAMSSALNWFHGSCTTDLPMNLLQAQRDCFGAHQYERIDAPRGTFFHTVWPEV